MALIHIDTGRTPRGEKALWVFIWGPLAEQPTGKDHLPELDLLPMYGKEYMIEF